MSPKIAVVTPYYREPPELLRRCHTSVSAQTLPACHFMVADGFPSVDIERWKVSHLTLPTAHGDNGNCARGIGARLAEAEGFEFIAFLDADNWFAPSHLGSLLEVWRRTGAPVCCSLRSFHSDDGVELDISEPLEDRFDHVDTSCLLLHRSAFQLNEIWLRMPRELSPICDRIFLAGAKAQGVAIASSGARTVCFRSQYRPHFELAGREPPELAKTASDLMPSLRFLRSATGRSFAAEALGFDAYPHVFRPASSAARVPARS